MPAEQLSVVLGSQAYPVAAVRIADQSPLAADGGIGDLCATTWALLDLADQPAVAPVP